MFCHFDDGFDDDDDEEEADTTHVLFSDTSQPDVRDRLNSPLLVTHATHAPPLSWRQSCEVQFSISLNLSAFLCFG